MSTQPVRIRFRCPNCRTAIKAPEAAGGKAGTCPKCHQRLMIPSRNQPDDLATPIGDLVGLTNSSADAPALKTSSEVSSKQDMTIAGVRFEDAPEAPPLVPPRPSSHPGASVSISASASQSGLPTTRTAGAHAGAHASSHRPPSPKSAAVAAEADAYIGRTLGGDYQVLAFIGAGGIARVYKGRQLSLDRLVAIKILTGPALNEQRKARFRREAHTASRISHSNVLQVFASGIENTLCWMVMEYIDGGDVYARVSKGVAVPWPTGFSWFKQALSGLQAAHDINAVHRDLKPQNLMLTNSGVLKIADFGLVKVADDDINLTGDGRTVGTPAYIAPEQALGEDVDLRADIYSLGATFYHVFAGVPVFRATSSTAVLLKHVQENPVPLEDSIGSVPIPICRVINRMLEKPRECRYQSAAVALADLESYERFGGMKPREGAENGARLGSPDTPMSAELVAPPSNSGSGSGAGLNVNSQSAITKARR